MKEISIMFTLKYSDNSVDSLNNTIILKLMELLNNEYSNCRDITYPDVQNDTLDEIITLLKFKKYKYKEL